MNLVPGQRALEVGCGTGVFLPSMAQAVGSAGHVDGVDHAGDLLRRARARLDAEGVSEIVSLVVADATRLPFPDDHFDAAHVERVLMHLPDPELALAEMRRVVKPGGVVVAAEPIARGARFDHPDYEAMEAIVNQTTAGFRHPAMGLALPRLMANAGYNDRQIGVSFGMLTAYSDMDAESHRVAAAELVEIGTLSQERADTCLDFLYRANETGTLMGYALVFVVSGRVPPA
jgi:SAM-dependent methyltransferase